MKATEFSVMMGQDLETIRSSKPHLVGVLEGLKELTQAEPSIEIDQTKTLESCFNSINERAKAKQQGGYYCVPPEEALKIIGDYFGFTKFVAVTHSVEQSTTKEIDLDDLF